MYTKGVGLEAVNPFASSYIGTFLKCAFENIFLEVAVEIHEIKLRNEKTFHSEMQAYFENIQVIFFVALSGT